MHKKGESTKKSETGTPFLSAALFGSGIAMLLFLLLAFLLAIGVWSGFWELPALVLPALTGFCAFVGGRVSIGQGKGNPMLVSMVSAALLLLTVMLVFLLRSEELSPYPPFLSVLLMILAGGGAAGVMGRKKKKKRG